MERSGWTSRSALALLLLGFAFFAFVACYNGLVVLKLDTGVIADARVVDVTRGPKGATVTVEFATGDGELVRTECTGCGADLDVGDGVRLRYDPSYPDFNEPVGNRSHQRVLIVGLVVMVAFALPAAVVGRRSLRERRQRHLPR